MANWWDSLAVPDSAFPKPAPSLPTPSQGAGTPSTPLLPAPPASNDLLASLRAGRDSQIAAMQQAASAPTPSLPVPTQPKPGFDLGNVGSALWEGATQQFLPGLKSAAAQAYTGINPVEPGSIAERWMAEGRQAQEQSQTRLEQLRQAGQTDSSSEAIREAMPSLGFSLVNMAGSLPAGLLVGAAGTAAGGPVAGGMAGSAAAGSVGAALGYRMAGSQLLNDSLAEMEKESQTQRGRGLSAEERNRAVEVLTPIAQDTGLWEAGPEFVGNAMMFGLGRVALGFLPKQSMAKLAQSALGRAGVRAAAGAGALGAEVATEGVTQFHQGPNQQRAGAATQAILAGQDPQAAIASVEPMYQGVEGLWQATKDVAPATIATVLMMGGIAKPIHMAGAAIENRRAGNARVDQAEQDTAALRANLDVANEQDIAQALSGFDQLETQGLPKHAAARLDQARQQLTRELALRASPESLAEPLETARGRAGYLGLAERADSLSDEQLLQAASRPLPQDVAPEIAKAHKMYGSALAKRQQWAKVAEGLTNPDAAKIMSSTLRQIVSGKPLTAGGYGSRDFNLASLSDDMLERYRLAADVLGRSDTAGKSVQAASEALNQEAERRASGQRRDAASVRLSETAAKVALAPEAKIAGMLKGLSTEGLDRIAGRLNELATANPLLADRARSVLDQARQSRMQQFNPAGAQQAGITSAMQGWNQGQGRPAQPSPGRPVPAEQGQQPTAPIITRNIPTPAATGQSMLADALQRQQALQQEVAGLNQQPAAPTLPTPPQWGGSTLGGSSQPIQAAPQVGPSFAPQPLSGPAELTSLLGTNPPAPTLPTPAPPQGPTSLADLLGRDARLDVVPSSVSAQGPVAPPALTSRLPSLPNVQGRQTVQQAQAAPPVELSTGPEGARRGGTEGTGASENTPHGEIKTRSIDLSRSHAEIMGQIAERRDGMVYRSVKDIAAVRDVIDSGFVKDSSGAGVFASPRGAFAKYVFGPGKDTGYIIEMDNEGFEKAQNAGHDIKIFGYLKSDDPVPLRNVSRIIKITKDKTTPANNRAVSYQVIYSRESSENLTSAARGGQTGREAPQTTATSPQPEPSNAQERQTEAEAAPLLNQGQSAPAGTGAVENKQPKQKLVLWGFKPGTADAPIKLSQFSKGEQARRQKDGWTTAAYAEGDSPTGLIEQAKSARSTIAKPDITTSKNQKVVTAPFEDMIDESGNITRGGDYINKLLIPLSDAELEEVKVWSRKRSPQAARWIGDSVVAEQRTRNKKAEPNPAPTQKVVTVAGTETEVRPEVVELADLITSDDARFPKELQPRDRSRIASTEQISSIAARLDPMQLADSRLASDGAPIVGPDGVVESGNGRTLALREVYTRGRLKEKADAYRAMLAERGFDVAGMKEPVLIRRRVTSMTPTQRKTFTEEANARNIMGMSPAERALVHAGRLTPSLLDLYRGGDLTTLANGDFVRGFMAEVAMNESAEMMDAGGRLNQEGIRRIESAILARAYPNADLLGTLLESTDNNIKAIGGALLDSATGMVQLKSRIEKGLSPTELDITQPIVEASQLVAKARRDDVVLSELLSQSDMFGGGINPTAKRIVRLFFSDSDLKRQVSRDKIGYILNTYASQAKAIQRGDPLFQDAPTPTVGDLINALEDRSRATTRQQQASLLGGNPAGESRPPSQPEVQRPSTSPAGEPVGKPESGESRPAEGGKAEETDLGALFDQELEKAFANVPSPRESVEPGGENRPRENGMGESDVRAERPGTTGSPGRTGGRTDQGGPLEQGGAGVSDNAPAVPGKKGARRVRREDGTARTSDRVPGSDDTGRGGRTGSERVRTASKGRARPVQSAATPDAGVAPTAGEKAASAARETAAGLKATMDGLAALFGGKGKLSSGLTFDEDTYRQAVPFFRDAVRHFAQAAQDARESIRLLIKAMMDGGYNKEVIANMKPYAVRFIEDVQAGKINLAESSEQPAPPQSEPETIQPERLDLADKQTAQRRAESIAVEPRNPDNIRATLPFLLPEQQDDVLKAEQRFDQFNGILYTNATGTGKTYTGLGIIKRMVKQGKNNVLVIVPAQQKVSDWIEDGRNLGLDITGLPDTKTGGTGLVITTYANFRDNDGLSRRDWDLIVYDESHYLMSNQSATQTANLNRHNQLTLRPSGINRRARTLLSPADRTRLEQIEERARRSRGGVATYGREVEEEYEKLEQKVAEISAQLREKPNPKVVFLSATPFAYHKNIDYAEGLLFDWGPEPVSRGYNTPTARENFLITHFGYRMRTGKLTDPETDVDVDLMERRFHEWLKSTGAVSGRKLTIDRDYSREFVEIPDKIGPQIDRGINILSGYSPEGREKKNGREENKFSSLGLALKDSFDYFAKTRLLETIKAREAAQRAKQHVGLGRKVVVFHDYIEANVSHPFRFLKKEISPDDPATTAAKKREWNDEVDRFDREFPDLGELNLSGLHSTIDTFRREFGERVGFFNGRETKKARSEAIRQFNRDDSKIDVIVVQRDAGKEGISLHDVSGNRQRALIDLGLPTAPTEAIQTEGRIYRYGNRSDAIIEYLKTNTQYEEHIFGNKVATRTRTAENLAMGNEARNLQRAFIDAYLNSTSDSPNKEQGRDGKASDARANTGDPFDNAISFYFSNRKKTVRDKSAEGVDYYATPEPLGLKMVEWANLKAGESALEPSAGHGAIARFFPEDTKNTFIEPSPELMTLLEVNARGNVKGEQFENLHVNNKYDAIVMNPPFGSGGKTAIDHLEKAATHLRDGGRIVALLPEGPAADKRLEAFLSGDNGLYRVADIGLPTVTFTRAGTSVKTHIVVLEKHLNAKDAPTDLGRSDIAADEIKEFFEAIRHRSLPPRMAVTQPPAQTPSQIMAEVDTGGMTPAARELLELAQKEPVLFSGWLVEKNGRPVLTEEKAAELVGIANPSMAGWTVKERVMLIVMGRHGSSGISIGPDANKLYRNGMATMGRAGMALNAAGKEALQRYKDISGPLLRMLSAETQATTPAEPIRSPSSPAAPATTLHVTTHAKKSREQGKQVPWFVVSLNKRVDRDTYQQLSNTAKEFGGFYSSYDKQGAIPGFQFPTQADAEAFQAKIDNPAIRRSVPSTATTKPATVAQARASLVKALGEKHVTALERAGRLMLHEKDPTKTGAAGYVDGKGVIHLIPSNMDQTALDVALHEAMHLARDDRFSEGERAKVRLAHAALRLVGLKNFVGNPGFNDLVQQVRRMAAEGNKTAQDALAKARLEDPNNIDEEAIAYLAQYADEKLPLVRRVLAAIRAALYRMGIKVNLTPADVRALALSALKAQARAANREMMSARRATEAFSLPDFAPTAADRAEVERQMKAVKEVRDGQGRLLAPNGKPSKLNERQWKQVRTDFFKNWFGDWENDPKNSSKVVDENGEPRVIYHGTAEDFLEFNSDKLGINTKNAGNKLGFFFTDRDYIAEVYAIWAKSNDEKSTRVISVFANVVNPYYAKEEILDRLAPNSQDRENELAILKKIKDSGKYDGIIFRTKHNGNEYVIFSPTQIKSAIGNVGTFSNRSNRIDYSQPITTEDAAEQERLWQEFQAVRARFQARPPSETAFKKWFGKGTEGITARNGQPITLYHGTNNPEFNRWDESRSGQASEHPTSGLGFFMTADPRAAKRYGSRVLELHARINKPYYMTDADLTSIETVQDAARFRKKLLAQGYDGAVITAPGGAPYVVALESKQVKYTTNENPTDSEDFRYSKSSAIATDAEYMAAVERGDMETAQQMVDEAAKAKGYNVGPVWHGNDRGPLEGNAFRVLGNTYLGVYFSAKKDYASNYGNPSKFFIKIENPKYLNLDDRESPNYSTPSSGEIVENDMIIGFYRKLDDAAKTKLTNLGYDGIRVQYDGVKDFEVVAFFSSQIKSADPVTRDFSGNVIPLSKRFNAATQDIRYSRPGRPPRMDSPRVAAKVLGDIGELRDTIKPGEKALAKLNPTNWRQMLADLKANTRPQWLGLLTQDHLLELARKHLPAGAVRQFDDASERMEAYENRMIQAEGFPLADRWQTLMRNNRAQADALGLALHMSTWLGVDPRQTAAPKGKQVEWVRAKAALSALTNPEARKLYDDVLGFYANQTKRLFEELEQRIQRHSLPEPDKRAARDLLRQEFERMKDEGPYVPLMRFGDLTVWAEPRNPGEKPVFATLETVQDQRAFADWLKSQGYQPRLGVKMDEITKRALPAGDMVGKLTGIIDKNLKGPQADAIKDAMYQLFLRSLPEQAIRKHFLHRKFVPGYSADAIRTFATFARRSAKQVARLAHGDRMGGALDEMAKAVRDGTVNDPVAAGHLVNELDKSYQWSMDPQTADWASRLTHLGFMWHLGASPAHLLLNLGQQAQLTLPWLAGELHDKKGFAAVAAALGKANLDFLRTNPFTDPAKRGASAKTLRARLEGEYGGDLGRALKALEEAGKTDKSQTYSISGMSSEDQFLWSRPWLRKITQGAAWFFHTAEVINREASAIAAYRLGRESGMGHEAAYDLARRAINETHYDYSPGNRSRFMRGNVAKVITLFKQYALNTSWQLARNAYLSARGATPAEKAVARTKLRGMLGMTALMAGAVGMPFYNELAWMLTQLMTAFGDDDEPEWDFDTWFRRTLDDALNPTASEAARRGLANAFVGIDLSSRIKLDDLWWRRTEDDQHGRQVAYSMLEQALGPVAGLAVRGISTVDGLWDALIEGTSARGASTRTLAEAMPKALKDISKSLRFATEGATTASGAPLMSREELGAGAIVGQAIGFRPAALTERQSANTAMLNLQDRIKRRRTAILDTLNMAVWQGDGEVIGALQSDIAAFNKRYPAMAITGDTIQNSIEAGARRRLELQLFGGAPLDRRLAPMLLSGEREE